MPMADENKEDRHNRELIELLNELRVALPGVQVLFAFLLAVPFANGFPKLGKLDRDRSEEHTSELQSRANVVCRLLLEKKKTRRLQGAICETADNSHACAVL